MIAAHSDKQIVGAVIHEAVVEGDIAPTGTLVVEAACVHQLEVDAVLNEIIRQRGSGGVHQINLAVVVVVAGRVVVGNFECHTLDLAKTSQALGRNDDFGVAIVIVAVGGYITGGAGGTVGVGKNAGRVVTAHDGSHLGVGVDGYNERNIGGGAVGLHAKGVVRV